MAKTSIFKEQLKLPWHAQAAEAVLEALQSRPQGLSESEVERRKKEYGPNLLPEQGMVPLWKILLAQFVSPLIYVLILAAVVSAMVGDLKDALFIAAVLIINAGIGAYQELQAEKSSQALRKMLRVHAHVERDGDVSEILAEDLVPGDIVWLESGNRVPADLRLLSTQGLEVDESLLTGESIAVEKDGNWIGDAADQMSDRRNIGFAGSIVARGRGKGLVIGTGTSTAVGQLAVDVMGSAEGKPPLLDRMERFTNQIAIATLISSVFIGILAKWMGNYSWTDTFFFAIALAVSAIPEGLPVAMTVALSVATTRMARRNVIVRRLTAVEGLGSCTMIATDKTGTLTCNELTVREIALVNGERYSVTGEGFAPVGEVTQDGRAVEVEAENGLIELAHCVVLCNEADLLHKGAEWTWRGDAVDIALLSLGRKLNVIRERLLDDQPQIAQIPFESERQFAATYHRFDGRTRVFAKGAPEKIMELCSDLSIADRRKELSELTDRMAERGLRVIAVASGECDEQVSHDALPPEPKDLTLLGFIGMIDPPRAGVREAISSCRDAGVLVSMITGDHRVTALAIAKDLKLAESEQEVLAAVDIQDKSHEELIKIVEKVRVFARVTPRQKLEIVNAARDAGHFVAVTGDGVNDAPALRAANIGVAMGKSGTDVAREAAELVVSDDNFTSIVAGIEEGRIAYDNIRKVIYLLVSTGAAELFMVLMAVLTRQPIPLFPVQLLWLNLVTNGIQGAALAFEPGEGDSLQRRPRPRDESIFNRLMTQRVIFAVLVIGIGGFLTFFIALQMGWSEDAARNLLLLVMVLFELTHIGNCRSERHSAFALSPLRNPLLFFGSGTALLLHIFAMYTPFMQNILKCSPVDAQTWLVAILVSLTVIPVIEIHKAWWNRYRDHS